MSFLKSVISDDADTTGATGEPKRPSAAQAAWRRARGWAVAWWRISTQSRFFFPLLLMLVAVSLYLPRLTMPEKYLFDEILFAYTAGEYAEGNADSYEWDHPCSAAKDPERCAELYPEAVQEGGRIGRYQWAHPPVGKLFMAGGILLFGNDAYGWRIMSVLAGAVGVAVAYQLGLMVTGRVAIGLLTAGLLLLDGMYLVYSRLGLADIFLVVLTTSMLLAFTWYLRAPPERTRIPLLVTGLLISLAIATKWSAGYGAFFIGLVVVWRCFSLWRSSRGPDATSETRLGLRHHLIWGPVALAVFPVAVYLIAYLPYFISGGNSFSDFIELQKTILHLQTTLDTDPRTASRWWSWPLDIRSVWFGTRNYSDGRVAITYALGNPLLYWAFLPAILWTVIRWWRSRHTIALTVLLIGFFGQWLPWALVDRATYLYHFLPMVPFGCLALAATVVHICETHRDWRRTLAIEYVVLILLAFVFFYPILSYYPLSEFEYDLRIWFSSWR